MSKCDGWSIWLPWQKKIVPEIITVASLESLTPHKHFMLHLNGLEIRDPIFALKTSLYPLMATLPGHIKACKARLEKAACPSNS